MIGSGHLIAHRHWAPSRKTDITADVMDRLRDWAPRTTPTTQQEEKDMPLTPADGQTVLNTRVEIPEGLREDYAATAYTAEQMLLGANYWAQKAAKMVATVAAQAAARDTAILAAINGDDVDMDAVQAAAKAGAAEALADFHAPVDPPVDPTPPTP